MSRLKNIKIYWNMHMPKTNGGKSETKFLESNCWQGDILMMEDGYFEGIVKSNRKDEQEIKHLVFGIINENVSRVYKIDDSNSPIHIFSFNDNIFSAIYLEEQSFESAYGECKIEIKEKEEKIDSCNDLLKNIKDFKNNKEFNDYNFYNNMSGDIKKFRLVNVLNA
jgi:hypothetical protein